MSELKHQLMMTKEHSWVFAYPEYEADKVIADLENKLDLYKRGFKEDDRINAYLYAELRRQKYKRCLAMAKWCASEEETHRPLGAFCGCGNESKEEFFYARWADKWLELAEKFKDG